MCNLRTRIFISVVSQTLENSSNTDNINSLHFIALLVLSLIENDIALLILPFFKSKVFILLFC